MTYTSIPARDAAKALRKDLKRLWPDVTFRVRVRNSTYNQCLEVSWQDGPTPASVEAIATFYDGYTTDRSDADPYRVPKEPIWRDGQRVRFSVNYVFCNRGYSERFLLAIGAPLAQRYGIDMPEYRRYENGAMADGFGDEGYWIDQHCNVVGHYGFRELVWQEAQQTDAQTLFGQQAPAPVQRQPAPAVEGVPEYEIEHSGDWTWLRFAGKPAEPIRDAIKPLGFRWSKKRTAWYAPLRVEEQAIAEAITAAADAPARSRPPALPLLLRQLPQRAPCLRSSASCARQRTRWSAALRRS